LFEFIENIIRERVVEIISDPDFALQRAELDRRFPWSKGTSIATGVPDLAMMVPSPRAAASTNSENFALASARLSCFMLRRVMTLALIAFTYHMET
jgi:hypothetical protein